MTSSGIQCYFCSELIKDDGDNDDDGDDDADTEKVRLFLPLTCHNLLIVLWTILFYYKQIIDPLSSLNDGEIKSPR